ncbi:MAG: YebC/PmpR family DNA-binding transcriptional regulator, partial [Planctomycetia bacterium]
GYAAGGVAVMCEILTDNKNRTAPEIRKIFEMCDGKLGGTGCVAYLFQRVGIVRVPQSACAEDRVMEVALEAGASDVQAVGDRWEVSCEPATMAPVADALRQAGLPVESSEITRVPTNTVDVEDVEMARKVLQLVERLDDHDDVQSVAANFSIPDEALAQLG